MTVVLDTHAWIWFLNADRKLGQEAQSKIEAAFQQDQAVISAITLWEISMLVARGRILLPRDTLEWLDAHLSRPGLSVHPLSSAIAVGSATLSGVLHGDPADRIIIATARHLDAILITADERILSYGMDGYVKANDARQ